MTIMIQPFLKRPAAFIPHRAFHSLASREKRQSSNGVQGVPKGTRLHKTYGGVILTRGKGGKYALVKGRCTGKWSFPKGHSDPDESSMECAKREILEETGISELPMPSDFKKIGFGHYYIFEVSSEIPLIPRDTREIIETKWVTLEEMQEMRLNADVTKYIKNIE